MIWAAERHHGLKLVVISFRIEQAHLILLCRQPIDDRGDGCGLSASGGTGNQQPHPISRQGERVARSLSAKMCMGPLKVGLLLTFEALPKGKKCDRSELTAPRTSEISTQPVHLLQRVGLDQADLKVAGFSRRPILAQKVLFNFDRWRFVCWHEKDRSAYADLLCDFTHGIV